MRGGEWNPPAVQVGMILHWKNEDWDRPEIDNVPLTNDEIRMIPLPHIKVRMTSWVQNDPESLRMGITFPVTTLSERFKDVTYVKFHRHTGMRSFAMGCHARLGADSPIRVLAGSDDILRAIGKFAGSY